MPVERLRWIAFSHLEADECGAVNEFLEAAPHAQVAHGALGCMLSLNDQLARPPRALADGDVLEIGGAALRRSVVEITTPHVPHNWESHMFYEQETGTLFCGDLMTQLGDGPAVTSDDLLERAVEAEDVFHQTSLGPLVPATYRRVAELAPERLAIMHGSSYEGDAGALLRAMADVYEQRFGCGSAVAAQPLPGHDQPVGTPS
jgi:flavorubredoxin